MIRIKTVSLVAGKHKFDIGSASFFDKNFFQEPASSRTLSILTNQQRLDASQSHRLHAKRVRLRDKNTINTQSRGQGCL